MQGTGGSGHQVTVLKEAAYAPCVRGVACLAGARRGVSLVIDVCLTVLQAVLAHGVVLGRRS